MSNSLIPGYGKVLALGHADLADLLNGFVVVQEKLDGSQFSFGRINGELHCRSKSVAIQIDAPPKQFSAAVEAVKAVADKLEEGVIYRGEVLASPRHNVLQYSRTPKNYIALYDVIIEGIPQPDGVILKEATRLGFDKVETLWTGPGKDLSMEMLRKFVGETTSALGGALVEGVVIKNREKNSHRPDGGIMLKGKLVSEAFKETHQKVWKEISPNQADIIELLADIYANPARWAKAVQHLRDAGTLTETPKDIGPLIKEVQNDITNECWQEIQEKLWKWAWPKLQSKVTRGLPMWWKEQLAQKQFESTVDAVLKEVGDAIQDLD